MPRFCLCKAYILFLGMWLWDYGSVVAQNGYWVKGQVFLDESTLVEVAVLQNDDLSTQKIITRKDGTFETLLDWDKVYRIHFVKSGYVTKIVEFSTWVPATKNKNDIEPYSLQVRLFKTFSGVDSVYFEKPVAKIRYDSKIDDFDYDLDYSLLVKKRIDQMLSLQKTLGTPKAVTKKREITILNGDKVTDANVVAASNKPNTNVPNVDHKSTAKFNWRATLPGPVISPLKAFYPQGRTVEQFPLEKKTVTRVIMKHIDRQRVFLMVKHNWGPTYYFIDESPLTIRCVSRSVYERETLLSASE